MTTTTTTMTGPTGVPGTTFDEATRRRAGPEGVRAAGPADHAVVVGVVGACGGVGASTLSAALAVAGTRGGERAVVVELRHTGAGIDVLLGIEDEPGLRWADLHDARGEVDATRLLDLLPRWSGVHVLSTDRSRRLAQPEEVERDVLRAVAAAAGLVVLDLPADRLADHAASCDAVVVVARCETLSVAGAQSAVADLGPVPLGLVCRGSTAGRLLPHEVAAAVGAELWGEIVSDPGSAAAVEAGAGPSVRFGREAGGMGRGKVRVSLGTAAAAVLAHAQAVAGSRQAGASRQAAVPWPVVR